MNPTYTGRKQLQINACGRRTRQGRYITRRVQQFDRINSNLVSAMNTQDRLSAQWGHPDAFFLWNNLCCLQWVQFSIWICVLLLPYANLSLQAQFLYLQNGDSNIPLPYQATIKANDMINIISCLAQNYQNNLWAYLNSYLNFLELSKVLYRWYALSLQNIHSEVQLYIWSQTCEKPLSSVFTSKLSLLAFFPWTKPNWSFLSPEQAPAWNGTQKPWHFGHPPNEWGKWKAFLWPSGENSLAEFGTIPSARSEPCYNQEKRDQKWFSWYLLLLHKNTFVHHLAKGEKIHQRLLGYNNQNVYPVIYLHQRKERN